MDSKVTVFSVENKAGTSKKTGNAYSMDIAQCKVTTHDGKVFVGELVLPKDHEKVEPGDYVATFGVAKDASNRITGQLLKLTPAGRAAASPRAA